MIFIYDSCDLAGSERLGKTMVEGINRSEARYINSSLLELGYDDRYFNIPHCL